MNRATKRMIWKPVRVGGLTPFARALVHVVLIGFVGLAVAALVLLLTGCVQIGHLPKDAAAAFANPEAGNRRLWVQTVRTTGISRERALWAGSNALRQVGFDGAKEQTEDRTCAESSVGWHEWTMWACFYVVEEGGGVTTRVIVHTWRPNRAGPAWHVTLASAYRNELGS